MGTFVFFFSNRVDSAAELESFHGIVSSFPPPTAAAAKRTG